MRRLAPAILLAAVLLPAPAFAAEGWAVCAAFESGGAGRLVHTAQPYARDSAQVEADAVAFARAAGGGDQPACHWEPTRDKAADYLRRLKEGAGRRAAEARTVSFSPAG